MSTDKRKGNGWGGARPERIDLQSVTLHVKEGPDAGLRTNLGFDFVRIGKGADCDLVLTDPLVSRRHAEIRIQDDGILLRDLGSTNGTFVGDIRVSEVRLARSFECLLGNTVLEVEARAEPRYALEPREDRLGPMVGSSPAMRRLFGMLRAVATAPVTVLVQGETGTGKDLVARVLHDLSGRRGSLVVFDAAASNPNLIGTDLFGHVKGAFTGAASSREGAFRRAERGTLFVDEIGELPLELQPRLLRVLECREILPIGSDQPRRVDVRVVVATHRDLGAMVARGIFREDLYHRLGVVRLAVPPLRERLEDVPLLIDALVKQLDLDLRLSPQVHQALCTHPWPGNVRSLKNQLERLAVISRGREATLADLELPALPREQAERSEMDPERVRIQAALRRNRGNKSATARELAIPISTLKRRLKEYARDSPRGTG